ncbi:uncharacterized protein LOC142240098 [Haematobia irritans]|uniref:uncharacterized protein LOC142240098 n=1 Tax=Haematobia irritans TaxID=7368 RepID=UPI003F4FC528
MDGYSVVHCCRRDGYGGTSLFVMDTLKYTVNRCESRHFFDVIQISLVDLKVKGKPLSITTFYRSQKCDLNSFYSFLEDCVQYSGRYPSIYVGDSNIDCLDDNLSTDLSNILFQYDYKNCHVLVTRPGSGKSLDNVYSNIHDMIGVNSIECDMTDHNIISCNVSLETQGSDFTRYRISRCDYDILLEQLQRRLAVTYSSRGSLDYTSSFIQVFTESIDVSTTVIEKTVSTRYRIVPWVNRNLQALIELKKKLLRKRCKRGLGASEERILKQLSMIVRKAGRISMNMYYQDKLEGLQQNPKRCWKFLNEQLGRNLNKDLQLVNDRGEFVAEGSEMCELFNDYFIEIPKLLKEKVVRLSGDHCNLLNSLTQSPHIFGFRNISEDEVTASFSALEMDKCPGHDGISGKMLVKCRELVVPALTYGFNQMITTSQYPEAFRIAKVIPIPKEKGAKNSADYRPIALLSSVDKIFQRILYSQMMSFLSEHKIVQDFQFGFRKGCGTQEAVVNVMDMICDGLDSGFGGVAGVFYDFSKAFDLVECEILLQKLLLYGFDGYSLKLIRSFLSDRKQYVQIKESRSEMAYVQYGVPQGSVLGPLLFMLYINDIANLKLFGKLVAYADDISLFYPYNHDVILRAQIERDAETLREFARINRLVLNAEKTKVVRFRPHSAGNYLSVSICGRDVLECSSVKYLGIHLQSNLAWDLHIQSIKGKIAPAIGLLYKFRNKFSDGTNLLLYNSLIHSHLNYLPIVYAYRKSGALKSLQRMQNKALRIVYKLPRMYSTISLYQNVAKTILPINGIYKMQLLKRDSCHQGNYT